jgi:hypothetical protein
MDIEFSRKDLDIIDTARLIYEKKTRRLNSLPEFVKLLSLKLSLDIIGGVISEAPKKAYVRNGKVRKIPDYYAPFRQANEIKKKIKKSKSLKDTQSL